MSDSFRLGLVGTGDMAAVHAAAARRVGLDLGVAVGRDAARAQSLAEETGAVLYESYDALLADPAVTAVDVCVPNDLHRPVAERAFAAGKHVLCEKPIALTLDDADAMIAAAQRAGVVFMVGHVVRFWPEYARLREVIRAGEVGDVRWLSLRRLTGVLSATTGREGWRADPSRSGGAALDLQIHDLDIGCWLFGAPGAVFARGVRSPSGTWDHLLTALTYDDRTVMVEASFLMQSAPFNLGFHLVADRGVVAYDYSPEAFALHGLHGAGTEAGAPAPSLWLYRSGDEPVALYTPERDSFELAIDGEIAEFAASIRERRPPRCSGEDARLALAVSIASRDSCETGHEITRRF